jgi:serine/threonine protein kinase
MAGSVRWSWWCAPELLLGNVCTSASDVFSLGVILWELCTGKTPGVSTQGRHYRRVEFPREAPQSISDLIGRCMTHDPDERPTAQEVHDVIQATVKFSKSERQAA